MFSLCPLKHLVKNKKFGLSLSNATRLTIKTKKAEPYVKAARLSLLTRGYPHLPLG